MPETRNSKSSAGSPGTGIDKNPQCSEFVTTSMLNEMLQIQERMFKTLLDSLLNNFNSRLDTVVESVADIKTRLNICQKDTSEFKASLEFSQKDIDDLKMKMETEVVADINDIYDCIDYHIDKLEYLGTKVVGITSELMVYQKKRMNRGILQRKKSSRCSQRSSTLLWSPTLNAPIVSVGLLLAPEDALARSSVGFATGDKRTR